MSDPLRRKYGVRVRGIVLIFYAHLVLLTVLPFFLSYPPHPPFISFLFFYFSQYLLQPLCPHHYASLPLTLLFSFPIRVWSLHLCHRTLGIPIHAVCLVTYRVTTGTPFRGAATIFSCVCTLPQGTE